VIIADFYHYIAYKVLVSGFSVKVKKAQTACSIPFSTIVFAQKLVSTANCKHNLAFFDGIFHLRLYVSCIMACDIYVAVSTAADEKNIHLFKICFISYIMIYNV